jgi:hypothetical protein
LSAYLIINSEGEALPLRVYGLWRSLKISFSASAAESDLGDLFLRDEILSACRGEYQIFDELNLQHYV